jgi:uncharacterized protein YndB with AHSA1/START domain
MAPGEKAMAMEYEIEFNAPPEKVFAFVTDPATHPRWLKGVESTTFAPGSDPTQPGALFVQKIREGGELHDYQGTLTGWEKDRRYALHLVGPAFTFDVDYRFEPLEGNRTQMTFSAQFPEAGGFKKFLIACFNPLFKVMIGKQMKKLRELVEGRG